MTRTSSVNVCFVLDKTISWLVIVLAHGNNRPSPEYSCRKRNPLYPIRAASFVSTVLYFIHLPRSRRAH